MRPFDLPPLWLALAIALAWLQARWLPVAAWPDGSWTEPAGAVLVGLGLVLIVLAIAELVRHKTTPVPHREPSALVTGGVFRFSRNPIYLGDAMVLLGLILRWEAAIALILVPGFVWLIDRRFVRPEEDRLCAAFGEAFAAYAAKVRPWV